MNNDDYFTELERWQKAKVDTRAYTKRMQEESLRRYAYLAGQALPRPEPQQSMTTAYLPWRPADEAPTLKPLLCYWAPQPDAEGEADRSEFWAVAVCRKQGNFVRWHMYCPMWEGGCGNQYESAPDAFTHLPSRPVIPTNAEGCKGGSDGCY
ncbi:hypothetical protein [Stenotrophomonas sp.]|uniref:hypothetical protein n=1 Tax=Stenotrophomonas sp. TaxID=69392 RepID=UPI00289AA253|nr:hypothetical protein [Stenotrophomonas sp.]